MQPDHKLSILIVDDDPATRTILNAICSTVGQCAEADDGETALASFEGVLGTPDAFDVVILDINMERMDGDVALQQLRKLESRHNIPIDDRVLTIMTSAVENVTEFRKALFDDQADAFIPKPIEPDAVLNTITNLQKFKSFLPRTELADNE